MNEKAGNLKQTDLANKNAESQKKITEEAETLRNQLFDLLEKKSCFKISFVTLPQSTKTL